MHYWTWGFLCFVLCWWAPERFELLHVRLCPCPKAAEQLQCSVMEVGASSPRFLVPWVPALFSDTAPVHLAAESCAAAPVPDPGHAGALPARPLGREFFKPHHLMGAPFCSLFPSFICNLPCWQLVSLQLSQFSPCLFLGFKKEWCTVLSALT